MERISSLQNPKIKHVVRLLEKAADRKQENLTVVEGRREIGLAAAAHRLHSVFVCPELSGGPLRLPVAPEAVFEVSRAVFDKMAYRENRDGVVAVVEPNRLSLDTVVLGGNPLVVVLEAVEKPGNLGAVLRTADAARVDAVLVCDPQTDVYNPNVIRSSIGCVFSNQVVACTTDAALAWLRRNGIRLCAAALTAEQYYHLADLSGPLALVMGTEATGLSHKWLQAADLQVKIPMRGAIDSLNVSASTAVLVFEAQRQRGFV